MDDKETIARRRAEFLDAFNKQNIGQLESLLSDDHISMPPNQPEIKGIDSTRTFWRERFGLAKSQFSVISEDVEVIGDAAIDHFRWTMDITPHGGGRGIRDEGKCIWIWRRSKDGGWKIARAMWNSELPVGGLWSGAPTR